MSDSRRAAFILWALLAGALLVRLLHVDAPIVGVNSWRQADTAAIARNFHVEGRSLLSPAVDWRGDGSGLVETELPIFPWLVAQAYALFGVHESIARVLTALFSVASLWALHGLVVLCVDRRTALWSVAAVAFLPLSIYYGRTVQPDALMAMCALFGLYFCARFVRGASSRDLALSCVFIAAAIANKLTAVFLGLPLLYLLWLRFGSDLLRRSAFYAYGVAALFPAVLWYAHAHSLYLETGLSFGIWEYGSDKWGNWALVASSDYWKRVGYAYLVKRHFVYVGFVLFAIGLCLPRRSAIERVFDVWLLAGLLFLVIVGRGNYEHEYYQWLVFVPMCVFAAKLCARGFRGAIGLRSLALAGCVAAVLVSSVDRYAKYMAREREGARAELALAARVARAVPVGGLVVSASAGDPTLLYLADRKGWVVGVEALRPERLLQLEGRGARAVFGLKEGLALADGQLDGLQSAGRIELVYEDSEAFLALLPE